MTLALNLGITIPGIMKKIIKFIIALETLIFIIFGCTKENGPMSVIAEGYIVGHVQCDEFTEDGQGTGKLTEHGFCIIIENHKYSFVTFTLPEDLIDFSPELLISHNLNNGGPYFFPDSLQNEFNIRFKYHKSKKNEFVYFGCLSTYGEPPFPWGNWIQIIIEEAERIED